MVKTHLKSMISLGIGALLLSLCLIVGISALTRNDVPVNFLVMMSQDVQIQVDVARINTNHQRSNFITIYNNSPLGNQQGTPVNEDATSLENTNSIRLNSYYNAFENLSYNDTLVFTLTNFTNAQNYPNKCLKFEIVDVLDGFGNSVFHELTPNNSISYVKMYDGTNVITGTLNLTNILAYQDYTNIFIKAAVTIVDYDYTIFECDNYKIKEYTEAEYAKNSYGIKYSGHTAAQIAADIAGTPLTTNDYAEVKGMMGYYYYLEMGEYPMDYVGDTLNTLLTRTDTNDQGYTPTDDLHSSGTGEMLANQIIKDPTTNEVLYNFTLYKTYNQVLYTKYLNDAGTETIGFKVCPIYWFEDILTREINSNGKPIYGTGDKYVRSQVYGYINVATYKVKYYSTCSGNNFAVDGTVINEPIFSQNNYDWFKVEPCKWLIYSLENGDANTIPSGSENSFQLKTISNAISQNRQLKTKAEQYYDTFTFNFSGNNWATSNLKATLNGITGTTIKTVGANSATAPYTFNENATLTDYIALNMSSTYNRNDNIFSPFIDNVFTKSSQNYIALTKNTTYFSQDTNNNLIKTTSNGNESTNPFYSLTQDKLYPLSVALTGETNAYNEFNTTETASTRVNLRAKATDYAFGHYAINATYSSVEGLTLSIHNKLRSGSTKRSDCSYILLQDGQALHESMISNPYVTFTLGFHFQAF